MLSHMTALSLLERDAESFEIQDANGLSRFKSGFIVDNFLDIKLEIHYIKIINVRLI